MEALHIRMNEDRENAPAYEKKIPEFLERVLANQQLSMEIRATLEKLGEQPLTDSEEGKLGEEPRKKEKNVEKKSESTELKIERERVREFADAAKGVARALREREQERLTPLIDESYISRIAVAADRCESAVRSAKIDKEELDAALGSLTSALDQIGEAPRSRNINDSMESLTKVITRLKNVENMAPAIRSGLMGSEETSLLARLHRVENVAREKWLSLASRRSKLAEYLRR